MSVAGLKRMTTGSAVSALSYRATQVVVLFKLTIGNSSILTLIDLV